MEGKLVTRVVFGAGRAEWRYVNVECGKVIKGRLGFFCGDGAKRSTFAEATSLQRFIGVPPRSSHGRKMSNL